MPMEGHQIRAAIADEAAEWFFRNRGGASSSTERAEFAAWLRSSPLHVEEYLKTAVLSRDIQAAVSTLDTDVDALLESAGAEAGSRRVSIERFRPRGERAERPGFARLWQTTAVAAVAALVLAGIAWLQRDGQRFGIPKAFETARGEQRSWLLPDGTALTLDSDSAVIVHYGGRERLVQLERGQALFKVAHEATRRFRVEAGETGVIAVGTEFDVMRRTGSTEVTVVEGRVAVFTGRAPESAATAELPPESLSLSAGEQLKIADHAPAAPRSSVNVQQTVAWVQHQIAFEQRPLGEVADEFNRYSGIPIVIESAGLRALPISGVFSTYDADSFVAFISRLDGVRVERDPNRIVVLGD